MCAMGNRPWCTGSWDPFVLVLTDSFCIWYILPSYNNSGASKMHHPFSCVLRSVLGFSSFFVYPSLSRTTLIWTEIIIYFCHQECFPGIALDRQIIVQDWPQWQPIDLNQPHIETWACRAGKIAFSLRSCFNSVCFSYHTLPHCNCSRWKTWGLGLEGCL